MIRGRQAQLTRLSKAHPKLIAPEFSVHNEMGKRRHGEEGAALANNPARNAVAKLRGFQGFPVEHAGRKIACIVDVDLVE